MLTPLFVIPLCLAVASAASSGEKNQNLDARAVFGFAGTSEVAVSAAKASDYSYLAPVATSVVSTTDDEGRISTFSVVNGSTINVITTATGAPPVTITQVPSGQAGITTVINGETYTVASAISPSNSAGSSGHGSASALTPPWSVPLVSSAVLGLLGTVAGAYFAL